MSDIARGSVFSTQDDANCIALGQPGRFGLFEALTSDRHVTVFSTGMVTKVTGRCDLDKLLDSLIYG